MCLILEQRKKDALSRWESDDIYGRNSDGFGAMWIDAKGAVKTFRAVPDDADDAWRLYQRFAGRHCVLHWRMATSGIIDVGHAHPFRLAHDVAIMHNGVFSGLGDVKRSDTRTLVEDVLRPMIRSERDLAKPGVQWLLKEAAGYNQVLVTVSPKLGFQWVGREATKHRGRLYSNTYAWSAPVAPKRSKAIDMWREYDREDDTVFSDYSAASLTLDRQHVLYYGSDVESFLARICDDPTTAEYLADKDPEIQAYAVETVIDDLNLQCAAGFRVAIRRYDRNVCLICEPVPLLSAGHAGAEVKPTEPTAPPLSLVPPIKAKAE